MGSLDQAYTPPPPPLAIGLRLKVLPTHVSATTILRANRFLQLCRQIGYASACDFAPDCLQLNLMYTVTHDAAERLTRTDLYVKRGFGVIIVEGRHVMADPIIVGKGEGQDSVGPEIAASVSGAS